MATPVPENPASGVSEAEETLAICISRVNRLSRLHLDSEETLLDTFLYSQRRFATNSDITIECNDGQLRAHKSVLTSQSHYFATMFNCQMMESKTNKIVFKSLSAAIDVILRFIYVGLPFLSCTYDPKLVLEIIQVSHMLLITDVFKFYWKRSLEMLNVENLIEIWKEATKYEVYVWISRVLKFVCCNARFLPDRVVHQLDEAQIIAFFNHIKFENLKTEFVELILRWGSGDLSRRKDLVVQLVSSVEEMLACAFVGAQLKDEVLEDYRSDFKDVYVKKAIESYSLPADFELKITLVVVDAFSSETAQYELVRNTWSRTRILELPQQVCRSWRAIVSAKGELFYYGLSKSQKFVVYDSVVNECYLGPRSHNVTVSGFIDGDELYFREQHLFLAVFNLVSRKWKKLRIKLKEYGRIVSISNGNVYSDSNKEDNFFYHVLGTDSWTLVRKPDDTKMVLLKCRCLSSCCEEKLYFIHNCIGDPSLFVWNGSYDSWIEKVVPSIVDRVAVASNCDLDLIVFWEKGGSKMWLFFVSCERWFELPSSGLNVSPKSWVSVSFHC